MYVVIFAPVTLTLRHERDLDILRIPAYKNEVSRPMFSNVTSGANRTYRQKQTDVTERITRPHAAFTDVEWSMLKPTGKLHSVAKCHT